MKNLQLIILLSFLSMTTKAQVAANYIYTSLGCGPVTVNFTDSSTSSGSSLITWAWDFDNGQTSTEQSPTIIYSIGGGYNVCLTATNANGDSDTECKIVQLPGPNANDADCDGVPVSEDCDDNDPTNTNSNVDDFDCDGVPTSMDCDDNNPSLPLSNAQCNDGDCSNGEEIWDNVLCQCISINVPDPATCVDDGDCSNGEETWNVNTCECEQLNIPDPSACFDDGDCSNGVETWNPNTCECEQLYAPNISIPNTTLCEGDMISVNPTMTCSNCTVEIYDPNGILICNSLPCLFSPMSGIYTFTVIDNSIGCSNSDDFTITIADPININSSVMNPNCFGLSDGIIEITSVTGGASGYTYLWSTGAETPTITGLSGGTYAVTVTDANGCIGEHEVTLVEPTEVSVMVASISNVTCFGDFNGAIDITVTGGMGSYSYFWSDGSITEDQTGLTAGTYTVTVVDANMCEVVIQDILISEPPELLLSSTTTPATCNGGMDGSIDLIVTGGIPPYSYAWSGFWTTQDLQNLVSGTYTVTVTDNNACTVTESVTVEETLMEDIFTSNDTTICIGDEAQLNVWWLSNLAYQVQWSPSVGLSDPNSYSPIASPYETTVYTVVVSDGTGCSASAEVLVTVNNYLDFGLLMFSNSPVCEGEQLEFYSNLSGAASYLWTGPNGFSSTEENPFIPVADLSLNGQYDLMIIDNAGCDVSAIFDVFIDDDCVWPGDTDTNMVVNNFDLLNIGLAYDSIGPSRFGASLSWIGQGAENWTQSTPTTNVNFKHADTDGNGMVNSDDTLAITQNWGLTHNFTGTTIFNQFTDLPVADGSVLNVPFYVEPDTLPEGETIGLDIILGDMSNVVTGLYGIAFSIEYDTAVVVPGSASIDFSNCWLGDVNADAITIQRDFPAEGRIDAAITRIDGMEMDGAGFFGEFIITLDDDILFWDPRNDEPDNDVYADFTITNFHLINFVQEEIVVEATTTSAPVNGTTSIHNTYLDKQIQLYPNPANELFYISSSKNLFIEEIKIYSTTKLIKAFETKTIDVIEIPTMDLPNGIYFIELQTDKGLVTKKVSIVK